MIYHIFFILLFVCEHFCCFPVLAIINSAAVNIGMHVSFRIMVFGTFSTYRSGIAGLYGSSTFSFFKNLHTFFHSGYVNLPCHQQCRKVHFSSHLLLNLLIVDFLMEKAMGTHSSTLAWKIPWMEEPGRLRSMGSLRVGHD